MDLREQARTDAASFLKNHILWRHTEQNEQLLADAILAYEEANSWWGTQYWAPVFTQLERHSEPKETAQ